jgi:hypothetical protein
MVDHPDVGAPAGGADAGPGRRVRDDLASAAGGETLRGLRTPRQRPTGAGVRLPGLGRAVQPGMARLPAPHRPNRVGWIRPVGMSGAVSVEITAKQSFTNVLVRPGARGIHPAVNGRTITFALSKAGQASRDQWNNLSDWLAGCAMIYLTLFGIGKIIFGQTGLGLAFLGLAALAAGYVYWDLNRRGWSVLDDKT